MADKLRKYLSRLPSKDRDRVEAILARIYGGDLAGLDHKPLKGMKNLHRVRAGRIRIIFYHDGKTVELRRVTSRDDKTYKSL